MQERGRGAHNVSSVNVPIFCCVQILTHGKWANDTACKIVKGNVLNIGDNGVGAFGRNIPENWREISW